MSILINTLKEIFSKALPFKDTLKVSTLINDSVNKLGELGYYDFREYLVKI